MRHLIVACSMLALLFFAMPSSSFAQDTIFIENADTQRTESISQPTVLESLFEQVEQRIRFSYADRVHNIDLVPVPAALQTTFENVEERVRVTYGDRIVHMPMAGSLPAALTESLAVATARIRFTYADRNKVIPLAYPAALLGDATKPEVEEASTVTNGNIAALSWATDEFAICSIEYGTESGNYTEAIAGELFEKNHSVNLADLDEGTRYFVQVTCADQSGNSTTLPEFSFGFDAIAPEISDVSHVINEVSGADGTISATVTWATDESAKSEVRYGTEPGSYIESVIASEYADAHSITLDNLAEGITYFVQVVSTDRNGNATEAPEFSFVIDVTPPEISDVTVSYSDTGNQIAIEWTSNEQVIIVIEYGTTMGDYDTTLPSGASSGPQSSLLSTLKGGTKYFARIVATDPSGNVTSSSEFSFTTSFVTYMPVVQ